MSRGGKVRKRPTQTDPLYKSKVVTRFISKVMLNGKKSTAQSIVYGVIDSLAEDERESVRLFEEAIKNVMPKQEVRSRRVGGATYQVPTPLKHDRAESLAIRWLVEASRAKKGVSTMEALSQEIQAALKGEGTAVQKRNTVHKMAEANKAFAHLRW